MSKKRLFIVLSIVAAVLALLAWRTGPGFSSNVWNELFWMTTGALATTLLLELVLERDAAARRRREDTFAFRTFSASILTSILEIAEAPEERGEAVATAAVAGSTVFAAETSKVREEVAASSGVNDQCYLQVYGDISSALRDLAREYVRLFSSSHADMAQQYRALFILARQWEYRDVFRRDRKCYWERLSPGDPERVREVETLMSERAAVTRLSADTTSYIADAAHHVATKPGMSAPA